MSRRIASTTLNASTIDILNVIRQNASAEYQSLVPEVATAKEIPVVGEVLYGYPALANQFISALVNRIALVRVKSATFNNAYAQLKKGYLEFGETVEEVFVSIAKAREFSAEKAKDREFKRTMPDVRSAFHCMNWRVQYPITVQQEDLRMAFTSANGVQDLVARIVASVNTAAEYDEFLLFKYLLIKAVAHGKMYPVAFDASDMKNAAKKFRGMANQLTFMSNKYNAAGVTTTTPIADQQIFMDAQFNAEYDVDVLAAAFNMDKATFSGKLQLIDDFTNFDNDRFDVIRAGSDMIEEVTAAELNLMKDVKAILIDAEWFQVYDNLVNMTEQQVASGLYWNYFYNVWKTVSSSPFSNAVVFVDDAANVTADEVYDLEIVGKSVADNATVINAEVDFDEASVAAQMPINFVQTKAATEDGIAVHKYGSIMFPANADPYVPEVKIGDKLYVGARFAFGSTTEFTITGYSNKVISCVLTAAQVAAITDSYYKHGTTTAIKVMAGWYNGTTLVESGEIASATTSGVTLKDAPTTAPTTANKLKIGYFDANGFHDLAVAASIATTAAVGDTLKLVDYQVYDEA